jgi:mannose-6-phosphate isomerase-like protein (cupin superfamily)
VGLNLQ